VSGTPDPDAPTALVLVRHGETELTAQKRFSGSGGPDPGLSAKGLRQAGQIADALAARGPVHAVISSPLARCRQTAQAAADRLGLHVRVEPALRETDFGAFEGLTFAEVRDRHPAELDAWLDSSSAAPPGGESFDDVTERVSAAQDALLAEFPGRRVLLVSHVTPIKTLLRLALAAPTEALFRMDLAPASISAYSCYADGNASVHFFNDTHHLGD
jgi:ribonuclease H / adenosylcobalamin/alpha-ribazole phosphatase